ncbi:MAG: amidohydrolase family protein [Acidimicrobiales bacterium]|nr:amidohydrolase family protein [Acidimicrobiales bacterium]
MRTIVNNATVLDTTSMSYRPDQTVVIDDGIIVQVDSSAATGADVELDAAGAYVVPGLIDGHVHFRLATLNFRRLSVMSEVEFGIVMARLARQTVERGFTTVRDLGGDLFGLIRAIRSREALGPRIVTAGRMISQTGGHGDTEGGHLEMASCGCSLRSNNFSVVADGAEAVRKAARHNLRDGSDFLKIHVSGGVATPMDPLDSVQYTHEEISAAVVEAAHRRTYVAAHAYIPESILMAVESGVHSIEHGNMIDEEAAMAIADADSVLVPTLVAYHGMAELGEKLGFPKTNQDKNARVLEAGLRSLEIAKNAGVTMAYGTDLIGESQWMQNRELTIRSEVLSTAEILEAMWVNTPALCHMQGRIGVVAEGAFGDLVISRVDPLEDIVAFSDPASAFSHVLKGGEVVVDRS